MYSELADTLSGFKLWGLYHVLPLQYYIYIFPLVCMLPRACDRCKRWRQLISVFKLSCSPRKTCVCLFMTFLTLSNFYLEIYTFFHTLFLFLCRSPFPFPLLILLRPTFSLFHHGSLPNVPLPLTSPSSFSFPSRFLPLVLLLFAHPFLFVFP